MDQTPPQNLTDDSLLREEQSDNAVQDISDQAVLFRIRDGVCQKYAGREQAVIHVPEGVVRLNARLFENHHEIKQIFLPKTLHKVGKRAFGNCIFLENIHLNDGLLEIGDEAFAQCERLKSVVVPETVRRLGKMAFQDCKSLMYVGLPRKLKVIYTRTFEGCTRLKEIVWPENPTIEPLLFARCFEILLAWEYYQVKDGVCRRVLGDMFEICPNGELLTDILLLRHTYFKVLTLISVSAELDNDRLKSRHQIFQIFVSMTHILTKGDPCAMFWAARAVVQYVWHHAMHWTEVKQEVMLDLVRQVLTEIGGSGARIQVRDAMLFEEYLREGHSPEDAYDLYMTNMKQLYVEDPDFGFSSLRYHPQHWLNVAWLEPVRENNYWAFAECMDGLFQKIGGARHMHYMVPEPEGGYEAWLAAWSRVLHKHDFGILEFRVEKKQPVFMPRLFFAIEPSCGFYQMYEYLETLGISEILHFWYNGQDISDSKNNGLKLLD